MDVSRRTFLRGAALAGGAIAAAGLASCSPQPKTSTADAKIDAAAGAHPWEQAPEPITDIAEKKEYDIVIVGAGIAGISAAEAAARNGAKVVVIEKSAQVNARGVDVGNIGSRVQKEAGIDIDPREATRLLCQWSQQTVNRNLIYTWASRSGAVFDHVAELAEARGIHMIQADGSSGTAKLGWDTLPERWRVFPTAASFVSEDGVSDNTNLGRVLESAAADAGAEFVFAARAEQLVGNAETGVSGVIVTSKDGKHVQYNASKGVVLATGDIGSNEEMLKEFSPISLRSDVNAYMPEGCNTGDGILMGVWAGAAMSRSEAAPMIHQFAFSNYDFPLTSFYMSWLSVDRRGVRYGADLPFEPYLTNARMCTPGNVAWSIFDADYREYVKRQMPDTYEGHLEWTDHVFDEFVDGDFLVKADTLEELADKLGIPADSLANTVEEYNALYEAGTDLDFDVPAQFLTQVKTPPFYASPNLCSRLVVPFGLHVNDDSQVCTEDDEPIDGLFAIGNVQGDFFAYTYPVHCPGVSHGRCVTFGQLVGEALAQDTVISKTA